MTYYSIDIKGYSLTPHANTAIDLFHMRKEHLKITEIKYLVTGVEIDPIYLDCTYHFHVPVLIFLN